MLVWCLMCAALLVLMLFPLIYEEQIQSFILPSNLHITLRSLHNNLGRQIENWTQWKLLLPGLQLHVSLLPPVSGVLCSCLGSSSTDCPQRVCERICGPELVFVTVIC